MYGVTGTVNNYGVIQGGAGGLGGVGSTAGAAGAGGVGIQFTAGATVANQSGGLIEGVNGADAILFGAGTSRVVFYPGAAFTGNVDGGSGVSTLELASSSIAGILSGGLGAKYLDFAKVLVDAAAQWTMSANGQLAGVVLTDKGTLTNNATQSNTSAGTGYGVTIATGGTLINGSTLFDKAAITSTSDNAVSGRSGSIAVVIPAN